MFGLEEEALGLRILGCGDGPASFNAEWTEAGGRVISVDPLYAFSTEQIRARIAATYAQVMGGMERSRDLYVWREIASLEELGRRRMAAMDRFLADYDAGRRDGRYVTASLPTLPFADDSFDLALVSHLLFMYSDHLDEGAHLTGLRELLRVAREVRVFPLLRLDGGPSAHVEPVEAALRNEGYVVERRKVPYEFQRGGHTMLRLRRKVNG
jgi:SAM-dependent methyltransferase